MDPNRILIVDDELEVIDHLKGYFESHGLTVFTASTGERALELLEEHKPQLVLLDIKLGSGITGVEVLRRAKASKHKANIVVITAVDDRNVTDMAKGLGASDYITKPFSLEALEKVVLSKLKSGGETVS